MKRPAILAIVTLLLAACGSDNASVDNMAMGSDAELVGNRGRVLSSIQVPNYTYIEVRTDGRAVWLAGNPVEVANGEIITWNPEMVMHDFQSSTLNRTFDEVIFVTVVHRDEDLTPTAMEMGPETSTGTVRSTQNAAGYTYMELETDAGDIIWLAAPETDVAVADRVTWRGGSVMVNFASPSLEKTFPEILFVDGVTIGE